MSDKKKLVAQTYYEISDVSGSSTVLDVDRDKKVFTLLKNTYTANGMRHISLNELEQHINTYKLKKSAKTANQAILKGLYLDGFSSVNCVKNAPYLFFDIDIEVKKKKENTHLLAPATNEVIFRELKEIAVLVWRSNSGNGIAGILYVPQMAEYLNDRRDLHLQVGKKITSYLSDYLHNTTGITRIKFDDAQSKLRQIRYLAPQKQTREINNNPFVFTYQVEEKTKYIAPNVPAYRYSDHSTPYGTIYEQFNNNNDILKIAEQFSFKEVFKKGVNKIRVKHPNTTSATSGEIDTSLNVYFNYSESVSSKKSFTPSEMVCYFQFNDNWSDFRKYLIEQGYQEKKKPQDEVNAISEELKKQLIPITDEKEAGKVIFSYCYDLQTLEPEEKKAFIKQTCTRTEFENLFKAYLNLPDYRIQFDKNFTIQNYVSEALSAILDYTDVHKKVILRAETGKGKTTAFVRDFHKHRPEARLLVLVPLTVILRQNGKEYGDKGVFVDGSNVSYELEKTYYENLVFATYEQGVKILHYSNFDYLVIDEAHQLLTANSFKRSVIAELTPHLEENKVIGLTGTPTAIFKNIGYKIIDVDVKQPQKTAIEVRYLNKKPFNIALSHLSKVSGKTLMRLNDIKGIEILKKQLVSTKIFKESEILVLYSQEQIKSSQDYKQLAHERRFNDKIRLVLTTSLIDEGLSINQSGFTDVVFIETDYNPRPEPIKQFFARFRNEDKDRKNYLYLRTKKDQTAGRFVPEWSYKETLRALQNELNETNEDDVLSTYNSLFGNDPFFYEDKSVNKYYLGYSVTDILFKSLNVLQFRQFLEDNYNLQLSVNEAYEFENPSISLEAHTRKEIKKAIAGLWLSKKTEVLQILALHSLDTSIRKKLSIKQFGVSPEAKQFVLKQIKEFEKLYKSSEIIKGLGLDNPNGILLKYSINEFGNSEVTLNSDKVIKEEIMLLKLKNVIENPQNPNDKKEAARFIKFSIWCEDKKEFTNPQMFRELKKLGVHKNAAYNENRIFTILQWFDLVAKRNKKTNLITVKKR